MQLIRFSVVRRNSKIKLKKIRTKSFTFRKVISHLNEVICDLSVQAFILQFYFMKRPKIEEEREGEEDVTENSSSPVRNHQSSSNFWTSTPKSFEFNMLMDQSPSLSVLLSPPMSMMQSSAMPSSKDWWSPSMRNLSNMPENFSFQDTVSPLNMLSPEKGRAKRNIEVGSTSSASDETNNHTTLDEISQEHLQNNRKALAERLNRGNKNTINSTSSVVVSVPTPAPILRARSVEAPISIHSPIYLPLAGSMPIENFDSQQSSQDQDSNLSGLAAITAAAESFKAQPFNHHLQVGKKIQTTSSTIPQKITFREGPFTTRLSHFTIYFIT